MEKDERTPSVVASATKSRSTRARIQAHWGALDALVDAQSRGNEAIRRALAIFEGASSEFKSASVRWSNDEQIGQGAGIGNNQFKAFPGAGEVVSPAFPKGNANSGSADEDSRRAYSRAEQGLVLAKEQLERNAENLRLMEEELEAAKRCMGALYEADPRAPGAERKRTRANASRCVLDRGEFGCLMSPVDMTRAMAGLLQMYQSEFEMQETVVCSVGYSTPGEVFTAYRSALDVRPFTDDKFLQQVHEIRQLSEEMECVPTGEDA